MPCAELNWTDGPPAEGLQRYRSGAYFDAHESWETAWNATPAGPERSLLRALIQLTAALHHASRGNRAGARTLLGRVRAALEPLDARCGGLDIAALLADVRAWEAWLADEGPQPERPPDIPVD